MILEDATVKSRVAEFALAPFQHPDILPSLLPLILGAFVIEFYFGRHIHERLGWNTSVSNSIIWVATGANLLLTGAIDTAGKRYAAYFLIGIGSFVGYMNFYHRWSPSLAFRAASADAVYPLAYVTVVVVKTGMPVDVTVLKAGAAFILGTVAVFHVVRFLEPSSPDVLTRG